MPRRFLFSAALLALLPAAATARSGVSWLDLITPDRLVQRLAQTGVMMLRTQMDMKYSDMSVDLIGGRVSMTDIQMWPLADWDPNGDCEIDIGRLTLRTTPLDLLDQIRMKAQVSGVTASAACLPPDARGGLAMAGLDSISVPHLTMDIEYGVPASDASVRLFATVENAATVDLNVDFSYIWVDGRESLDAPDPVVFLKSATLAVENHGIWEAMKNQVPPPMSDPASAETFARQALSRVFSNMNGSDAPMSDAQQAFVDSVATTWPAFLNAPERLVLETGMDGDSFIDVTAIANDPRELFDTVLPRLSLAPARVSSMLPAATLSQAMGPGAAALSADDRRAVGIALVSGVGAPRSISAGLDLLSPLAQDGDGAAAMALSAALEDLAPEDAYVWTLLAGAAGVPGATARLDRLERVLPFAKVLDLQAEAAGGEKPSAAALQSVTLIRDQAAMHLSGQGQTRSYGAAAMWAMLAKAAGDPEAADILADVDEHVRLAGPGAQTAWRAAEDAASAQAMEVWVGQDMPALLGH